jgi:glycosyltransferase involved in cell wall biosynthesis
MKVTLITVVYNCQDFIEHCILSVILQDYPDLEYIVIDGSSSDDTGNIINRYIDHIDYYLSEPDHGMYDALNKGIAASTGDLIGVLNSDDYLVEQSIISQLVGELLSHNADAVYGNLNYVKRTDKDVIKRKWRSNHFHRKDFERGWMPAHPTLFIRKQYFQSYGGYALHLGTAADYELILRMLYKHRLNAVFLDKLVVHMRTGGVSNKNYKSLYLAAINDYRAMVYNEIPLPMLALLGKKLRKLKQFL